MCWSCQENATSEEVLQELNKNLLKAKTDSEYFNEWNTTSFGCLLYPSLGLDGLEAKQIAMEIFYLFKNWVQTQPVRYIPTNGSQPMLHPEVITNLYVWVENFSNPNKLSKERVIELTKRKIVELEKTQANNEMWFNTSLITGLGIFMAITYTYCPYFKF